MSVHQNVPTQSIVDALRRAFTQRPNPGRWHVSGRAVDALSTDFGRVVRSRPQVLVQARSAGDVRDVMRVANTLGVQVTPRGNGGNTEGQVVAKSGILLDLRGLNGIELPPAQADGAHVAHLGVGGTWDPAIDVIRRRGYGRGYPRLQLPLVPGYKNLTVGGTLSVGGGGYRSHARGMQVDHVTELEIVTGAGDWIAASPSHNAEVYWAALGGAGQVGVITRVTMRLVPDEIAEGKKLVFYELAFQNQAQFLEAILSPSVSDVFYEVQGNAMPTRRGWLYVVKGSVDSRVYNRDDLKVRYPGARIQRKAYLIRSGRHAKVESRVYDFGMKLIQRWSTPHPWATTFLPIETTADFFSEQLRIIQRRDLGRLGFVTVVPTANPQRPYTLYQTPAGDRFGSFGILYMPPNERAARPLWDQLAEMQRTADAVGGKSYLSDTVPTTVEAWEHYYGEQVERVCALKRRWDPNAVLKPVHPSQAVFFGG